jgi:hypothetical protein
MHACPYVSAYDSPSSSVVQCIQPIQSMTWGGHCNSFRGPISESGFALVPQTSTYSTADDQHVVSFGAATLFTEVRISWAWEETRYGLTGYALATAWTASVLRPYVIAQSNSEPNFKRVSHSFTPVDREGKTEKDEKREREKGSLIRPGWALLRLASLPRLADDMSCVLHWLRSRDINLNATAYIIGRGAWFLSPSCRQIFEVVTRKAWLCKINLEEEHGAFLDWFRSSGE